MRGAGFVERKEEAWGTEDREVVGGFWAESGGRVLCSEVAISRIFWARAMQYRIAVFQSQAVDLVNQHDIQGREHTQCTRIKLEKVS